MAVTIYRELTPEQFIQDYGLANLVALVPPEQIFAMLPEEYRRQILTRILALTEVDIQADGYVLDTGAAFMVSRTVPIADIRKLRYYAEIGDALPGTKAQALADIDSSIANLEATLQAFRDRRDAIAALRIA